MFYLLKNQIGIYVDEDHMSYKVKSAHFSFMSISSYVPYIPGHLYM